MSSYAPPMLKRVASAWALGKSLSHTPTTFTPSSLDNTGRWATWEIAPAPTTPTLIRSAIRLSANPASHPEPPACSRRGDQQPLALAPHAELEGAAAQHVARGRTQSSPDVRCGNQQLAGPGGNSHLGGAPG